MTPCRLSRFTARLPTISLTASKSTLTFGETMPSLTTCVSRHVQLTHSCIRSLKKYQRFGLEGSVSSRRRSALADVLSVRKRGRTCSQAPTPLLSPVGISCPFQLPPLTTVDAFSPCPSCLAPGNQYQ